VRIPKRLELHLAAGEDTPEMHLDVVRVSDRGGAVVATDAVVAARVPVGPGLVEAEPGEEIIPGAALSTRAWAEASRGSTGHGTLRLSFGEQVACAGERRPSMHFRPPEAAAGAERPPVDAMLEQAEAEYGVFQVVDLILDPEALHRLSRALGCGREGLRLRIPLTAGSSHRDWARLADTVGVLVEPAEGGGPTGLIVPISREGHR